MLLKLVDLLCSSWKVVLRHCDQVVQENRVQYCLLEFEAYRLRIRLTRNTELDAKLSHELIMLVADEAIHLNFFS